MNDVKIVEILDQWEQRIATHQYKVKKYITLEEFKSEVFIRFKKWANDKYFENGQYAQRGKSSIWNYLNRICSQVALEQFKSNNFIFTNRSMRNHKVEDLQDKQELYVDSVRDKYSKNAKKARSSRDIDNFHINESFKSLFRGKDIEIVTLLSQGFTKKEVCEKLDLTQNKLYNRIENHIKPILKDRI